MIALREITRITDNKISINIPIDFPAKEVEVIVLPLKNSHEIKTVNKTLPDLIEINIDNYASRIISEDRR